MTGCPISCRCSTAPSTGSTTVLTIGSFCLSKSFYPIKRIIRLLGDRGNSAIVDYTVLNHLLIRTCKVTYDFWLEVKDPWDCFQAAVGQIRNPEPVRACFSEISHEVLRVSKDHLVQIEKPA